MFYLTWICLICSTSESKVSSTQINGRKISEEEESLNAIEAPKKVPKRGKGRKGKALERAIVVEESATASSSPPSEIITSASEPTSSVNLHDVLTSSDLTENANDLTLTSTIASENAASESEMAAAMRISAVSLALEGLHIAFRTISCLTTLITESNVGSSSVNPTPIFPERIPARPGGATRRFPAAAVASTAIPPEILFFGDPRRPPPAEIGADPRQHGECVKQVVDITSAVYVMTAIIS
jgi:hypothetical protein